MTYQTERDHCLCVDFVILWKRWKTLIINVQSKSLIVLYLQFDCKTRLKCTNHRQDHRQDCTCRNKERKKLVTIIHTFDQYFLFYIPNRFNASVLSIWWIKWSDVRKVASTTKIDHHTGPHQGRLFRYRFHCSEWIFCSNKKQLVKTWCFAHCGF